MKTIIKIPALTLALILLLFFFEALLLAAADYFYRPSLSILSMVTTIISYTTIALGGLFFGAFVSPPLRYPMLIFVGSYLLVAFLCGGFAAIGAIAGRLALFLMAVLAVRWQKKRIKK